VNDSDLQGDTNVEIYREQWRALVAMRDSSFKNQGFGLRVESISFKAEAQEPLLLLPDYLAGCFLADRHRTVVRPVGLGNEFLPLARRLFAVPGIGVSFEAFHHEYPASVAALVEDRIALAAIAGASRRVRKTPTPPRSH